MILLRLLLHGLLILLGLALIAGMTGWAALAIYYGDSHTSLLQTGLAAGSALVGTATVIGVCFRRTRLPFLALFGVCFALALGWWLSIEPTNDRDWTAETARLAHATIEGNLVHVNNIRNFTYRTETDFIPAYYNKTFDLNKLDSVDLYAVYWMGPAIAHTMISFGFGEEDFLVVSIEARKEKGEGYSTIKGFFRQYELIHIVGDERDLVRLRTNVRNNPPEQVYRYTVGGPTEKARNFFLAYIDAINQQYLQPQFYNTLLTNCTNVIWMHSRINPDHLPFSWKVLASGYLPEYLYEMDVIENSLPFAELERRAHVNPRARAVGDVVDFSRLIRSPLSIPGPGTTQ